MLRSLVITMICSLIYASGASAQANLIEVVEKHFKNISRGSVKTAPLIIADIQAVDSKAAVAFLAAWQNKQLWYIKTNKQIVYATTEDQTIYALRDIKTGIPLGKVTRKKIKQIKPNSGLRALLGEALIEFRLASEDRLVRENALRSLSRHQKPEHLAPLQAAIAKESDRALKAHMVRLERVLTMQYGEITTERVRAIRSFSKDLRIETRGHLNSMLATTLHASKTPPLSEKVAKVLQPGTDLPFARAYEILVAKGLASPDIPSATKRAALISHIKDGAVEGLSVAHLNTDEARDKAYGALVAKRLAPPDVTDEEMVDAVLRAHFYTTYNEPNSEVVNAVKETLENINTKVRLSEIIDLALDGLSLASIYFLAAIGLAITFGVMRVINMAHGEFIMMGAYTGYVVQQLITNYTLSILVAIPLAFAVTFAVGAAMERLVIQHLYHRPLETLLATFGISIALRQIAKNIFGTQARPLTSPDWLDGALVINDVISISWIRIAIFILSILFFLVLIFTLNKTRFGLETRAVTQNPKMAACMGVNPDRINMLTFGLGSGIAGIAGVAIGLFAKVTSELGGDYIVQSFMTVVVGGVGSIWGTLAGAAMIGFLQKGIEWFNPSNTLAAQTYMIVFIIIFIQFRARGIVALRGRAAED